MRPLNEMNEYAMDLLEIELGGKSSVFLHYETIC